MTLASLLFLGIGIGFIVAFVGALVDYLLNLREKISERPESNPSCLLLVAGALGVTGIAAILLSLMSQNSIAPAIALGLGVFLGFNVGFALIFFVYLIVKRF